jgi:hypothetical protein
MHDIVGIRLCEKLDASETYFPGTNQRLIFVPLRSSSCHPGHDVEGRD